MPPAAFPNNSTTKLPSPGFNPGTRPYRSHKVRACDLCRKRKSRCTVDIPGQSCLLCRVQGAVCHYQDESFELSAASALDSAGWPKRQGVDKLPQSGQKRKRTPDTISPSISERKMEMSLKTSRTQPTGDERGTQIGGLGVEDPHNESVFIVGPVVADDAQVIEQHMPPEEPNKAEVSKSHPYNVYSNDPRKPILYTTVSRRRRGLRVGTPPGENQKEILEQILGPFKQDLVRLFLDRFNVAFPIFDSGSFWDSYISDKPHEPPPTLLCQLYSMSLVYWHHTPKLASHPKPDTRYAVNLTVAALHEEFSAPGLSTVSAALIDLTGRPIFSMTGNAVSCGRMVSLAHCLGLNRDPGGWSLSQHEMNLRIRLWWGVLIHDRWGSFGHGVPPQIARNQYDVPLPTLDVLLSEGPRATERVRAAHCHIALCRLTEILGELLPLVYDLQHKFPRETSKKLRQIRTDLEIWEDSLPDWLRAPASSIEPQIWGPSSLYLSFLTVKMLVSRVELNEAKNAEFDNPEARRYFQTECRKNAEDIVNFITSLKKENFEEFWLPYSAFHLTSTATLLVRCSLETTDREIGRSCLASVETLCAKLRRVREDEDWDVADMCLEHCDRILNRLSTTRGNSQQHYSVVGSNDSCLINPAAISLPETQTNNDIIDDMMSISSTFGGTTIEPLPFEMTGIWDVSLFQDLDP